MHRLVLCVWLAAMTGTALAFDNGQYDSVPPDIRAWFKSVVAPNGVSCCDVSDGHRTDYDVRKGAYWVPIEGQWMEVPERAIIRDRGNPVGQACGTSTIAAPSSSVASYRPTRSDVSRWNSLADVAQSGSLAPSSSGGTPLTDLCAEDLATIYAKPTPRVIAKARPAIDAHAKKFIEMSPFCVLATSGLDGSVDASPRGGSVGFVHVAGPHQLLMPDRAGNNRIDSFRNVVEGSGFVHLLFFVPGIDETLRVGGRGTLSADPDLLTSMVEFGKPPRAVLNVAVSEVYFHCGKALMRSKLWSPQKVARSVMPSISQVIHDQTSLGEPESQEIVEERYKAQL